jgi:hypothetical protein
MKLINLAFHIMTIIIFILESDLLFYNFSLFAHLILINPLFQKFGFETMTIPFICLSFLYAFAILKFRKMKKYVLKKMR